MATWTPESKSSIGGVTAYLLIDNSFFFLIDNTYKFEIQDGATIDWTNETKS
jgi:hypothetical protein